MNTLHKLILAAMTWVLVSCEYHDPSYVHESRLVYDAARLVQPQEFEGANLLSLFKQFVSVGCRGRTLARLTVSADR